MFTNVACNLLNTKTCQCSDYGNRFKKSRTALQITHDKIAEFDWLPSSCAYRLLAEGQSLPEWHPLITGSRSAMHQAGQSVRGKVIHEAHAGDWADHASLPGPANAWLFIGPAESRGQNVPR